MSKFSKSRLMATSAIAGLSILQIAAPAHAQDAFGIHNDQPETLEITVAEGEEVEGEDIGIYADNGAVVVNNAGVIHGDGDSVGSIESRPSGGIVIAQPGSSVTNAGAIAGANGIVTSYFFSEDEEGENLPPAALAADTRVENSGVIRGEAGTGVGLAGGGDIVNSGTIRGFSGIGGNGAQGIGAAITEFPDRIAEGVTGIGSITNSASGLIEGQGIGAVIAGGGTIDNAGVIRSNGQFNPATPNVTPIGVIVGASEDQTGRVATINNSGAINGFLGLIAAGSLDTAVINNSGTINGLAIAVLGQSTGELVVNNDEDGEIIANANAIASNTGTLTVDNAGLIRSNGQNGIAIATPDATIVNSGTIRGAQSAIVTLAPQDGEQALPANTSVENSGLIWGQSGNGVALTGGGSVLNSGTILGHGPQGVGVVIAEFAGAAASDVSGIGTIVNTEEGMIEGQRFGVLLAGGGTIENAGTIRSSGAFNPADPENVPFGIILTANAEQEGRTATLNNSGVVSGFLGVLANQTLDTAVINNSGLITAQQTAILGLNSGTLTVNNGEDGEIIGNGPAIGSNGGTLTVDNAGLIRSNGQAAINITTPDAVINNSGTIDGATNGIATASVQVSPGVIEDRSVNPTITNSGTIIGQNNDGIRLQNGGTVTNSGTILGLQNGQADGIYAADYVASVTNLAGGEISGVRTGIEMSSGGTIANAGEISGGAGGVLIQNGLDDEAAVDASIANSGSINGFDGGSGLAGHGAAVNGAFNTVSIDNSGEIAGSAGDGVYVNAYGDAETAALVTIANAEDGVIAGGQSGVHVERGALSLTNAGTIRGNGSNLGVDAAPDAGVTLSGSANMVVNSGTISGDRFGITTANYFNSATGQLEGLAVDTSILNSGTIIGENDDGVRLIGGGSVTNSGTITGAAGEFTDGISMFAYTGQANEDYGALVTNEADGEISGTRFGIILSGGGEVVNDGAITGVVGGIFIQGTAINSDPGEDRSGLTASVVNTGTIAGTGPQQSLGENGNGYGVGFGSDMSTATLVNSGTISSEQSVGVSQGSLADLTVTNAASGVISGATSGIYGSAGGTLTVDNAGTIRGEGTYDGFAAAPDAGITIGTRDSSVTNSGTISGAGAGITTAYLFDEELGELVFLAAGTTVSNSGTILGESNDGVRLIGGGSVTNSGTIRGEGSEFADGVSIYPFDQQAGDDFAGSVVNDAGGDISGARFGVILSGGGTVDNAGTITGEGPAGVLIQNGSPFAATGQLTNSGTITGTTGFGVAVADALGTAEVVNSGTIAGATDGVLLGNIGQATLVNTGTITGDNRGVWGDDSGPVTLDNAGTIVGASGVAVELGSFDDSVILRTGSAIDGIVDAGEGFDTLTLDGDVLELTQAQQLTEVEGFETLQVAAGYWSTSGYVGAFDNVAIDEAAALQVNEVDLGEDGLSSPILTSSVVNNGSLVLNFSGDDQLSELDALSISGTGGLSLIGDAVFTVDTESLTYTGGTTVSNGGLVLTGTLLGDVTTEGDGFFQLGVGGTEGNFAGNIVNNGGFIFNRSDDYDFLGAFSGNGTLVKDGDSILSFLGDYSFTGLTSILAGSVRIAGVIDPETNFNLGAGQLDISGTDQTIGGLSGDGEASVAIDGSKLTVDQDENTSFGGDITGDGSLDKAGDGTLNLTGTNSYTGPTAVNGGTLAVNGSIVSDVTVNAVGRLGGNGSVGNTTVTSNGTLAPGNSIGRLTINGDLALAAGSIYQVEVNAAGQGDRVDATGSVTIANTARVSVLAANGNYSPRTDFVVLTGATGVSGRFGSVTTDLAFLDPFLRYSSNQVTLSLYRNDIDFADVAVNFNQIGVADAVQALGIDNVLFETVLVQNAATAQATFGDLSGEIHASTVSGLVDDSRHVRNALLDLKGPEEAGLFVWGSAFGGWGDFDSNASQFGMETDHKGLVTGLGYGGQGFAAAVSAGIASSDFNFDGRNDSSDVETKYLAAHMSYGTGEGFRGGLGLSYAWHDIDTSRAVSGAPLGQTLTAKRDADTLQVFGELAYDLKTGKTAWSPFIRLAHVDSDAEAATEAGGTAALIVGNTGLKTTFLSLGAEVRFNAGEQGFQPFASAAWNRAFGDRIAAFDTRFVAGGPDFLILGAELPKNSAEVEAGFDYSAGKFRIGAAYSGTLAGDRTSHGARITARIAF